MRTNYKPNAEFEVREAVWNLEQALRHLKKAGAVRALVRVRAAIASAKGALRHAEHVEMRRSDDADEIPACAASMGCLCAGHARGNAADAACDTRE